MSDWGDDTDTGDWGDGKQDGTWPEEWSDEQREPALNPLVSAKADQLQHSPPAKTQLAKQSPKQDLLIRYDPQGRPAACCRMVKGPDGKPQQVSEWRRPTADEYNAIMMRAKFVQGGVVSVIPITTTNFENQMQKVPLGTVESPLWKKAAKVGVGLVVLGGLSYWGYRQLQER